MDANHRQLINSLNKLATNQFKYATNALFTDLDQLYRYFRYNNGAEGLARICGGYEQDCTSQYENLLKTVTQRMNELKNGAFAKVARSELTNDYEIRGNTIYNAKRAQSYAMIVMKAYQMNKMEMWKRRNKGLSTPSKTAEFEVRHLIKTTQEMMNNLNKEVLPLLVKYKTYPVAKLDHKQGGFFKGFSQNDKTTLNGMHTLIFAKNPDMKVAQKSSVTCPFKADDKSG